MSLLRGNSEFQVFVMAPVLTLFLASKISKLLEKAMKRQIFWTKHLHVY